MIDTVQLSPTVDVIQMNKSYNSDTLQTIALEDQDEKENCDQEQKEQLSGNPLAERDDSKHAELSSINLCKFSNERESSSGERTKRKPILKRTSDEIPICNTGWRGLPKVDPVKLDKSCSLVSAVSSDTSSLKISSPTVQHVGGRCTRARKVVFKYVHIRTYNQTVGDNPAVSFGVPISLDWEYKEWNPVSINTFENFREPRRVRRARQLVMNSYKREEKLAEYDISRAELVQAEMEAKRIRQRRERSMQSLPSFLRFLRSGTGVARKVKKRMGCRSSQQVEIVRMNHRYNRDSVSE